MALTVDYIYKFTLRLMKKNQAGGLKSTDFDINWNDAQGSYQDDLLGRFQAAAKSKTGLNTGLIEDETILQKLDPFTTPTTLDITTGIATKPSNLIFRLAMRINGYDVYKIRHNQIATVTASVIDPPSITDNTYYFVEYLDYYSYFPDTVTEVDLDYIATPVDVKWGYTYDGNGRQVYNEAFSVQPVWDSNSAREITKRMLTNLGVSYKDGDFMNFGKSVQLTGE